MDMHSSASAKIRKRKQKKENENKNHKKSGRKLTHFPNGKKVNLVRAFVVMFWRVENTLICIIYLGRRRLGSFLNFVRFCQNKASLELLGIIF